MSCSFYGNKDKSNVKKVAPITRDVKTASVQLQSDSKTRILGKWYRDEDRSSYWEFKDDGKVYFYVEGILDTTSTYSISHSCGENTDDKFEFLKIVDEDGNEYCSEINGINENNSGVLSLTSMQNLQVALFVNNVNVKIAD